MNVFEFDSYTTYLEKLSHSFPGKKRALTLKEFSDILGYKSPRSLAMVIKGQRSPSAEMIQRLALKTKMTPKEKQYFELLVQKDKANQKGNALANELQNKITELKSKKKNYKSLNDDVFKFISCWYHSPLYLLVLNSQYTPDFNLMSKKLKCKVSPLELKEGYEILKKLNLIDNQNMALEASLDIPSLARQTYHKQMMDRAKESLEEELTTNRELNSNTFKMNMNKVDLAKNRIKQFVDEFITEFHEDSAEDILQLNLQFFKHTRN